MTQTPASHNGRRTADRQDTFSSDVLPLHSAVAIDHDARAWHLLKLRFFGPALDGSQPYLMKVSLDAPVIPRDLVPDGATVASCLEMDNMVMLLAWLPQATVLIEVYSSSATVNISSATREQATSLAQRCEAFNQKTACSTISARVWHKAQNRPPAYKDHELSVPLWDQIAGNYPGVVRDQLASLMAMPRPEIPGRLVLWHGPPGTGKTTAVRALMSAWASWCAPQYITDPEKFFAEPSYITDVLTAAVKTSDGPTLERAAKPDAMWRLIIAEDSDEYLRVTARHDAGAAMGRLLNLTDGILGQCHQALVLITTNEEVRRLHPALVRPGRCLARIEFSPFSSMEAKEFIGPEHTLPDAPLTLAELLSIRGAFAPVGAANETDQPTGLYL